MKPSDVLQFLHALDAALVEYAPEGERLDLYLIGRSALILRYELTLATKDVDMVGRTGNLELERKALELFGPGTTNAATWGLYLQEVPQGLPPIPQTYCKKSSVIPGDWKVLRPQQPEAHDLAVTKLRRFHTTDREDLRILCDAGDLTPEGLERALDSAYAFSPDEEEDPGRKRAYENLRRVIAYLNGATRTL
jgi:hypothetical protein